MNTTKVSDDTFITIVDEELEYPTCIKSDPDLDQDENWCDLLVKEEYDEDEISKNNRKEQPDIVQVGINGDLMIIEEIEEKRVTIVEKLEEEDVTIIEEDVTLVEEENSLKPDFHVRCPHCPYKTKWVQYLTLHMKEHIAHECKNSPSDAILLFKCEFCYFETFTRNLMEFHKRHNHLRSSQGYYKCTFCTQKFKKKSVLAFHIQEVHERNPQNTEAVPVILDNKLPLKNGGIGTKRKQKTKEIPVFIGNKLYWKKVKTDDVEQDIPPKCPYCIFWSNDVELLKTHVQYKHTKRCMKKDDRGDCVITNTFQTKDVVVMVDGVACIKKVIIKK